MHFSNNIVRDGRDTQHPRENVEKIRLANLKADVGVEWFITAVMQWIFKKQGVKLRVGEPDFIDLE
jgi:hypothetical protein